MEIEPVNQTKQLTTNHFAFDIMMLNNHVYKTRLQEYLPVNDCNLHLLQNQ